MDVEKSISIMLDRNADCYDRSDALIALRMSGDSRTVELAGKLLGELVVEQKRLGFMRFRDQYPKIGALINEICDTFVRLREGKEVKLHASQIHAVLDRVVDEFSDPMIAGYAKATRNRLIEEGVLPD